MSTIFHEKLAAGGWKKLSLLEQMANIGSEVERSIGWREKGNEARAEAAGFRSLELMDLTLQDRKNAVRIREVARVRELFADFFFGENEYASTADSWRKYFLAFAIAARQGR